MQYNNNCCRELVELNLQSAIWDQEETLSHTRIHIGKKNCREMEQIGPHFVQQAYGFHFYAARSGQGFIGPYFHDLHAAGRSYRRKPKHARLHARQRVEKTTGTNHKERHQSQSESGYETVGEQTATKTEQTLQKAELGHGESSSQPAATVQKSSPLKRLLKDLQRCDVFIARSLTALEEHCDEGERELKKVFSLFQQHLKARELDLISELHATRKTAGSILKRRKATLDYLKDAASTSSQLDETQEFELMQQMKQFVAERKVDEEIGSVTRFNGDVDDMLPHIMGFGKVNNVRHLYTEWEENPDTIILRSKSNTTYLPLTSSPPPTSQCSPSQSDVDTTSHTQDTSPPEHDTTQQSQAKSADSAVAESSLSGVDDNATCHSPSDKAPVSEDKHKPLLTNKGVKTVTKYSPEQLKAIQARVKDSLKNQGVYLYDPITGAGPPKDLAAAERRNVAEKEGVQYIKGGGSKEGSRGWDLRKKKTPTQLRRERKKRQKERERRQRELEKAGSEDSDVQPLTPPPLPRARSTPTVTTPPPTTPLSSNEKEIATSPSTSMTGSQSPLSCDKSTLGARDHGTEVETLATLASKVWNK